MRSIWTACAAAAFQQSWLTLALGKWLAGRAVVEVTDADVARVTGEMIKVVEAVKERAVNARIILVDYLLIFDTDSRAASTETPLPVEQLEQCRAIGRAVDRAFVQTAERTGVELLKASELSVGHALGSSDSWITPYSQAADAPMPFHPTLTGMQAIADALYKLVAS